MLVVVCAWCDKYRWADGTWHATPQEQIPEGTLTSHGICDECLAKVKPTGKEARN